MIDGEAQRTIEWFLDSRILVAKLWHKYVVCISGRRLIASSNMKMNCVSSKFREPW